MRILLVFFTFWFCAQSFAAPPQQSDPVLPNLHLTPGGYVKKLTIQQICDKSWGRDERHVSDAMRKKVFALYGIDWSRHKDFEVDHLVSRELGGADVIDNLWPESYRTKPWDACRKDRLENYLHKLLCKHSITLKGARQMLINDWTIAYRKYFGIPPADAPCNH